MNVQSPQFPSIIKEKPFKQPKTTRLETIESLQMTFPLFPFLKIAPDESFFENTNFEYSAILLDNAFALG